MNGNKIGNQKTTGNRLGTIAMALAMMFALFGSIQVAEAKVYYTLYDVRYLHEEIPQNLQPYINYIEYDIPSPKIPGYDYGARLYLTEQGRDTVKSLSGLIILNSITNYIMTRSEWYPERSFLSVKTEIFQHAKWGRTEVHIQYFYQDLEDWEVPYKWIK